MCKGIRIYTQYRIIQVTSDPSCRVTDEFKFEIFIYSYDNKDSLTYYKTFEYDKLNRKTKEFSISPKYPENNISLEYFYNETEYPIKLFYLEKGITTQVNFEYVFDDKKNWIEQTKSINGKKLYVWKRELKYFE